MDLAALLGLVHADPRDLAARAVYADALLEVGDPRGELIALQLDRARAGTVPSRRELELLAAHRAAWLGPIAHALDRGTRIENGFLRLAVLRGDDRPPLDEAALGHPEWRTVEELDAVALDRRRDVRDEPAALLARLPAIATLFAGPAVIGQLAQRVRDHSLARLVLGFGDLQCLFRVLDAGTFPRLRAVRLTSGIIADEDLIQLGARLGRGIELELATGPQQPERIAQLIERLVGKVDAVGVSSTWGKARAALVDDRIAIELGDPDILSKPAFRAVLDTLGARRVVLRVGELYRVPPELAAAGFAIELR